MKSRMPLRRARPDQWGGLGGRAPGSTRPQAVLRINLKLGLTPRTGRWRRIAPIAMSDSPPEKNGFCSSEPGRFMPMYRAWPSQRIERRRIRLFVSRRILADTVSGSVVQRGATAQICQVVHAHARGDFAQPAAAGCEEPAQEPALLQFLEPRVPAFRAAADPVEDARELGRDHGLAVAEKAAGVIDQKQVISQGESVRASLHVTNRRRVDLRSGRARSSLRGRPTHVDPATLPWSAAFKSPARPWAFTCSTRW